MDDLISILMFAGFLLISLLPAWKKAKRAAQQEQPQQQPQQPQDSPWDEIFGDAESDDGEGEAFEEVEEDPYKAEEADTAPESQPVNEAYAKYSGVLDGLGNVIFDYDSAPAEEREPVPTVAMEPDTADDERLQFDLRTAVIGSAILNNPYREG